MLPDNAFQWLGGREWQREGVREGESEGKDKQYQSLVSNYYCY